MLQAKDLWSTSTLILGHLQPEDKMLDELRLSNQYNFALALKRSDPLPVNIYITQTKQTKLNSKVEGFITTALRRVEDNSHRVRSLRIHGIRSQSIALALFDKSPSFPLLQQLYIACQDSTRTEWIGDGPMSSPNLTELRLSFAGIPPEVPASVIAQLRSYHALLSIPKLYSTIKAGKSLVKLDMTLLEEDGGWNSLHNTHSSSSSLKKLSLATDRFVDQLLDHLTLPCLESLALLWTNDRPLRQTPSPSTVMDLFIQRSKCHIVSLTLTDAPLSLNELEDLFKSLPRLTTLQLIESPHKTSMEVNMVTPGLLEILRAKEPEETHNHGLSKLLPVLESLTLRNHLPLDEASLRQLAIGRSGGKIKFELSATRVEGHRGMIYMFGSIWVTLL